MYIHTPTKIFILIITCQSSPFRHIDRPFSLLLLFALCHTEMMNIHIYFNVMD